jgi:hypothetical protein
LNEVSLPRSGKGINLLDVQGIVVINVKKRWIGIKLIVN